MEETNVNRGKDADFHMISTSENLEFVNLISRSKVLVEMVKTVNGHIIPQRN